MVTLVEVWPLGEREKAVETQAVNFFVLQLPDPLAVLPWKHGKRLLFVN